MTNLIEDILETEEDTQKGRFLTFSLGKEEYGIEIRYVTEIIDIQQIVEIPNLPDYIKGVINLRGKIIPVMDMRLRFKKKEKAYTDRTCIIIIDIEDLCIGLIVDSVSEVLSIREADIAPPPELDSNRTSKYIKAMGKVANTVKLILDCDKLLLDEDL